MGNSAVAHLPKRPVLVRPQVRAEAVRRSISVPRAKIPSAGVRYAPVEESTEYLERQLQIPRGGALGVISF